MAENIVIKNTQKNACQLFVKISNRHFEFQGNYSLQIDRKIGDTLNKFQLSIIDSSGSNELEIDRNISWKGSNKSIEVWYGNKPDSTKNKDTLVHMSGFITDYQHSFVGSVYKLDLSGYLSMTYGNNASSTTGYRYKINFGNYYAMRKSTALPWAPIDFEHSGWEDTLDLAGVFSAETYKKINEYLKNGYNDNGVILKPGSAEFEKKIKEYAKERAKLINIDLTFVGPLIGPQLMGRNELFGLVLGSLDNYITTTINNNKTGGSTTLRVPDIFVKWDGDTNEYNEENEDVLCNDLRVFGLSMTTPSDNSQTTVFPYDHSTGWGKPGTPNDKNGDSQYRFLNAGGTEYIWVGDCSVDTDRYAKDTGGYVGLPSWLKFKVAYPNWDLENSDKEEDKLELEKQKAERDLGVLQVTRRHNGYKAGIFVANGNFRPSDIVEKLCQLENWKYKKSDIVRTASLSSDDSCKICNDKTAMAYILEDLCPKSRTDDGSKGNYIAYFDSKGYFHFCPLNTNDTGDYTYINMGYNIPNSPVIGLTIKTKGSVLMAGVHDTVSAINSETGTVNTTDITLSNDRTYESPILSMLDTASDIEINKIDGRFDYSTVEPGASSIDDTKSSWKKLANSYFNEQIYQFLGYNVYSLSDLITYLKDAADGKIYTGESAQFNSNWSKYAMASSTSGPDETTNTGQHDLNNIYKQLINAELTIFGDYRIKPNGYIYLNNYVRGGRLHYTSGKYWVQSIQDSMDASGYRQKLTLVRFTKDNALFDEDSDLNKPNNVSKGVESK